MKNYSFAERIKVDQLFNQYFNVSFRMFYDGLISVMSKRLVIDILKFDNWLHSQFGNYEDNKTSMKDIIISKFGKEACELIESL